VNSVTSSCGASIKRALSEGEISTAETSSAVHLSVYDLNEDWLHTNNLFTDLLHIGGAFHTAVEVYGQEWSYGQEGVSSIRPRCHEVHVFRQSIYMGQTSKSMQEVTRLIENDVLPRWRGSDYDLLRRNCCTFADFLCRRLVQKQIPAWVNRFPKVASAASRGIGSVMDFGGSVAKSTTDAFRSTSGVARGCAGAAHGCVRRSMSRDSTHSNHSQATTTTVVSAVSSRSSSEAGSPRSPRSPRATRIYDFTSMYALPGSDSPRTLRAESEAVFA